MLSIDKYINRKSKHLLFNLLKGIITDTFSYLSKKYKKSRKPFDLRLSFRKPTFVEYFHLQKRIT
jgi:uncharacterized protein YcgL (UPF0745 family)